MTAAAPSSSKLLHQNWLPFCFRFAHSLLVMWWAIATGLQVKASTYFPRLYQPQYIAASGQSPG